ncbi:MAG: TRAP transporter fused permease subunit [Rhodovarius sp.]|nr:TRAP transporter fused permease subunit [Rhodovarius sp.]MCX7931837.1 TRAP transporter fused permease subunit [Rhodovarius sp.]MDW8313500.1 TRAP transporter fused permease subunit [Rhodovarius sp.]
MAEGKAPARLPEDPEARSARLSGPAFWVAFLLAACGLVLAVNQVFNLGLFGFRPIATAYYYLILGCFGGFAFLAFPALKRQRARVPWFDWLLAAATVALGIWLASAALTIQLAGWNVTAPDWAAWLGLVLILLVLDGVRRTGEVVLFFACLLFGIFPVFAGEMPGFLWGVAFSPLDAVREHVFGTESIIGIPMQVVSDTLIGFLVFGVVLSATGGASFFMDFALALMGTSRGGPAKVAVVSSATFGMLSGSPTSNVLTTGTLTIPTMKRCGYAPHYAGAVEACASTGGALMPPVMGAAAFIMANFLNVPYAEVMVAALLPSLLFYAALFLQTDLYAIRRGLRGVSREEVPPLGPTLAAGWYYIAAIVALTVLLLVFRIEAQAPFWVSLFLLLIALLRARRSGFNLRRFCGLVVDAGQAIAQIVALIAGIGLIIGALSMTGVANSFSRELVQYAGGNVALLLFFGALTSFILGMGMTASACYIFLAIVLAPALVQAGLDPMASHLYVLYWGIVSFITPPVALAAIAAASIAGSSPMKTGLMALRVGCLLLLLPVLFVLQPALILRGEWMVILQAVATAAVAILLLASAFEGYLYRVGVLAPVPRLLVLAGGLLLLVPEATTDLIGLLLGAAGAGLALLVRRPRPA